MTTDNIDFRSKLEANQQQNEEICKRLDPWQVEHGQIRLEVYLLNKSLSASIGGDYDRAERFGGMLDRLHANES